MPRATLSTSTIRSGVACNALTWLLLCLLLLGIPAYAQQEGAAELLVLSAQVELRRAGTERFIPVRESVLGSGDSLRTNFAGGARVVFTEDTDVRLAPNTTYTIDDYTTDDAVTLVTTLTAGRADHRYAPLPDADYRLQTELGEVSTSGADFAAEVRENGQVALLVTAGSTELTTADAALMVGAGEGARIEADGTVSDVVLAASLAELDALIDGCTVEIRVRDYRRVPLYAAPNAGAGGIGTVDPATLTNVIGTTADRAWYRVASADGVGWVAAADFDRVRLGACAALRVFPADHTEETESVPAPADLPELFNAEEPPSLAEERDLAWRYCTGDLPPPPEWVPHTLQLGQTLFLLASRTDTTVEQLALVNCVADVRGLQAGEVIFLPSAP